MEIAICQMMNLQRLQQMIDVFRASQDCGNDYYAAALRRNTAGRIPQTWQQLRLEQQRGDPIPQSHRQLADSEGQWDRAKKELPFCETARFRRAHKSQRGQKRE